MPDKQSDSELTSLKTTRTMREKAQLCGRCVITILKFWKICFRKKGTKKDM